MCRIAATLALSAFWVIVLLPSMAGASDGDVDYSAPYITVDPETGELITVNPGPRPAMHDMAVAQERDSEQAQLSDSEGTAQDRNSAKRSFLALAAVGGGLLAVVLFLVRRGRRSRVSSSARASRS